jgi:hypothetical protein
MAHGGSLTINPHTGLAEAGFLSKLLPALVGAGLMMVPGMQPLGAAAIVGGGAALAKGDLKAGLMAGLGAYGGAGLMGGLTTAGAQQVAGETLANEAAGQTVAQTAAPQVGGFNFGTQDAALMGEGPVITQPIAAAPGAASGMAPLPASTYGATATPDQLASAKASTSFSDLASKGIRGLDTEAGRSAAISGMGGGTQAAKYGAAASFDPIVDSLQPKPLPEEDPYDGPLSRYKFDPDQYRSADRSQPNPYYTPRRYNYADGGTVEQMSNANVIGANTGYPMADINKAAYSTPYQTPVPQNVVQGSADTGVNPMTGEQTRFAEGGITGSGNLDLSIPLNFGGGGGGGGGFGGGGQGGGAFGVGNGGGGQSQSAFGQGGQSSSMPGFSGGQGGLSGGLGQMQTLPATQDPFANDDNFKNYQNQMQGMVKDFQGSDQYKNIMSLNDTMRNYQQQRLGTAGSPSLNTPAVQQAAAQSMRPSFNDSNLSYEYDNPILEGLGGQLGQSTPFAQQRMGMNPGLYGGPPQKPSYDQYAAQNNQRLAEKSRAGSVASMQHDYVGPTMSSAEFEAFQNAPKNPATSMAQGGMAYAGGGISSLGSYSDGGRMLKGPGDGMSDNIPAQIGSKQPARLADGEFVVPADVVSHLGNGSTDAGARQLYGMMDRIRSQRTGKKKQAPRVNPKKAMPV